MQAVVDGRFRAEGKVIAWTGGGNDRRTTSYVIAACRSESGISSARSTGSRTPREG